MITAQNITSHELIGLHTTIIKSSNCQLVGLNGTVIDETKSMLKLDTATGVKLIPKDINVWEFLIGRSKISVQGHVIAKRPFDRIGAKT